MMSPGRTSIMRAGSNEDAEPTATGAQPRWRAPACRCFEPANAASKVARAKTDAKAIDQKRVIVSSYADMTAGTSPDEPSVACPIVAIPGDAAV
jgi:hypothetical protein